MPKNPPTQTSSAAAPPKKPPIVDTEIFTPKPPPDLPPNVRVSPPAQAISNRSIYNINDDELIAALKDNPEYVLGRLNWQNSNYGRKRLEKILQSHPDFQPLINRHAPDFFAPTAQTQSQPAAAPTQKIPLATAEQLTKQEAAIPPKENDITAENAPAIEKWMNGIKPGFYEYLAGKQFDAATSQHMFTNSFLDYLAMYKGGLAGFYLSQGAHELLYSALGPVGDALSSLHQKDLRWKIKWMKNPLNPNALYYYLNVLPEESAFKLLFLPVKATWGILARGGAPLITKATYRETGRRGYGEVKTGYFFTPTLKLTQGANILADGLDKLTGIPTNDNFFRLDFSKPTPFDQYIKKKNHDFTDALNELKKAKTMGQPSRIFGANQKIKSLLRQYDGNFFKQWFKPGFTNLSRRLRQHHNDPISYLLALVGGTIFDVLVGIAANLAKTVASRTLGLIPGVNVLRARVTEFFTSNRWLNTARIGGATGQAFLKGTFSMTTASSTYAGASIGGWIANTLGLPAYPFQVIGGGIGATFGSIYTTSLKMSYTRIPAWVQEYQTFKGAQTWRLDEGGVWGEQGLKENFVNRGRWGFGPGPLSRFANWLYNHPFARLPINGFLMADLGVKFLHWNPWLAYPGFIAGDYLWQIKGELAQRFTSWFRTTPIYKFYYSKVFLPVNTWFSNLIYEPILPEGSIFKLGVEVQRVLRPWANSLSKYFGSFFNPGFFAGFGLIPMMTPVIGVWGYVLGPLAGSATYLLGSRALIAIAKGVGIKTIGGISIAGKLGLNALPQINAWSWLGMGIGWVLDLIIPGAQPWLMPLFTYGLPVVLTFIPGLGALVSGLLAGIANYAFVMFDALLGGSALAASMMNLVMAALSTTVLTVVALTVFTGFVIYSAFWVPMLAEWRAQPTSTNFSIQTNVTQTGPSKYRLCAKFDVTQNILNINNYLNLTMDFEDSQLTVNLSDPPKVTTASRDNTNLEYMLDWIDPNLAPSHYGLGFPADDPPIVGGFQPMPTLPAHLSTPSNQKGSVDELMETNPGLVNSVIPFLGLLQEMAKDKLNPEGYIAYFVQGQQELQNLLNQQKTVLESLQKKVAAGNLADAKQYLDKQLPNNPVKNPEGISCLETDDRCLQYKSTVKSYFDSWPTFISQKLNFINNLIADPTAAKLAEAAALLEEEFSETEQMWENQKQLVNKLDKIKYKIFVADSEILTDPKIKIYDFANLPEDTRNKLWEILRNYFGEIFSLTTKYYYIPQGTSYGFCADTIYCADQPVNCAPAQPQTVCSSIYALTNIWIGSAFAKHCATFTPQ